MAKKWDRRIQVFLSDTHGGSKLSLMPLEVMLLDEHDNAWRPEATVSQKTIGKVYARAIKNVRHLASRDPIDVAHNGDLTHGNHYPDKELVSTRMADHMMIASGNLAPWLRYKQVKSMTLIKGTGIHEFGQGSATIIVGNYLQEKFKDKRIEICGHAVLVNGASFDVAHHGPSPGIRNWTRGNVLRLYTRSLMQDCFDVGEVPPDAVVRAHYHQYSAETVEIRKEGTTFRTVARILPSFSMLDDYARKVTKSTARVTIGLIAFEIINGKIHAVYDQEPDFMETIDLRTRVEL